MSILTELYRVAIELSKKEEEFEEMKQEYDNYRIIAESSCNNKSVRLIKEHISWYNAEELKEKAKEVQEEELIENQMMMIRAQKAKRRRREREEKLREKKERAAERKALDELMERERIERDRKKKEAN